MEQAQTNAVFAESIAAEAEAQAIATSSASRTADQQSAESARVLGKDLVDKPKHVLLVEDNAINQRLAARILAKLNYETTLASNGQEAVELMQTMRPDAILMDCQVCYILAYDDCD